MTFKPKLIALLLAASLLASSVQAQETRSLHIGDGKVHIDGKLVPTDELPASLDVSDLSVHFTFSGDVEPVVQINDRRYVLEGNALREAEPGEDDAVSFFFDDTPRPAQYQLRRPQHAAGVYRLASPPGAPEIEGVAPNVSFKFELVEPDDISAYAPHAEVLERTAREMHEQAALMEDLRVQLSELEVGQLEVEGVRELEDAARKMTVHAAQAARVAEAMPRIEMQHYLAGIKEKDKDLFDRLVNERERERETIQIAREIRAMADGADKAERTEELRRRLADIFELKQANRREEIQQLEMRLEDLQQKLEERERLRDEIIEGRLRELLNLEDEFKW